MNWRSSRLGPATYLAQRLPGARLPAGFARVLHQRTTGNPLFLVAMVDALVRQGVLRASATRLGVCGTRRPVAVRPPRDPTAVAERQVEQLAVEDQRLLEAASGPGRSRPRRPRLCSGAWRRSRSGAALARHGQFVRVCGTDAWPDGTWPRAMGSSTPLHVRCSTSGCQSGGACGASADRAPGWRRPWSHRHEHWQQNWPSILCAGMTRRPAVRYLHAAGSRRCSARRIRKRSCISPGA